MTNHENAEMLPISAFRLENAEMLPISAFRQGINEQLLKDIVESLKDYNRWRIFGKENPDGNKYEYIEVWENEFSAKSHRMKRIKTGGWTYIEKEGYEHNVRRYRFWRPYIGTGPSLELIKEQSEKFE